MISILHHNVLQALLMLATSDTCPERSWYPDEIWPAPTVRIQGCEIPLADGMTAKDARSFYRTARKLARGIT